MNYTIKLLKILSHSLHRASQRADEYQAILSCRNYMTRPDDIFVVTYPKSGTTWLQMILYQIFTDGNMDFGHIYEYSPFFEKAIGNHKRFEALPSPRVFKTHLRYNQMPKSHSRRIYVSRNGKDVAIAYYHHQILGHHARGARNGFNEDFAEFFKLFLKGKLGCGSWFRHTREWMAHRDDPNILFLTYEGLIQDFECSLRKILSFCGHEAEPAHMERIVERSSFAYMKQYESKFDPKKYPVFKRGTQSNPFIRAGKMGGWKECFTAEQEAAFNDVCAKEIGKLRPEDEILTL